MAFPLEKMAGAPVPRGRRVTYDSKKIAEDMY